MLKGLYYWIMFGLALGLAACGQQSDNHARIAVATNFLETAQKLETVFEAETDFTIDLVSGSTGQLYTQVINGAPYEAFLSADAERVTKLIEDGYGLEETRFTYAIGRLVSFSFNTSQNDLQTDRTYKFAIANPEIAPYGIAAMETIKVLDAMDRVNLGKFEIVYGQNVGQVYGFVKTGNADVGFAALSQMKGSEGYWIVPQKHHSPILQDALLLSRGESNEAATAFMAFLQTPQVRQFIKSSGYNLTEPT